MRIAGMDRSWRSARRAKRLAPPRFGVPRACARRTSPRSSSLVERSSRLRARGVCLHRVQIRPPRPRVQAPGGERASQPVVASLDPFELSLDLLPPPDHGERPRLCVRARASTGSTKPRTSRTGEPRRPRRAASREILRPWMRQHVFAVWDPGDAAPLLMGAAKRLAKRIRDGRRRA